MRLIYEILILPHKAFERIKDKPRVGLGLAVVLILGIVGFLLMAWGIREPLYRGFAERHPETTPAQDETMFIVSALAAAILFGGFYKFANIAVQGIVVHFLARMTGGGSIFKKSFGIAIWSKMPVVVGTWVAGIVTLFTHSSRFQIGPAYLFRANHFLFTLLFHVELFSIWSLILVAEGMVRVLGCKRLRSYLVVFGFWVLLILVYLGWEVFKKNL